MKNNISSIAILTSLLFFVMRSPAADVQKYFKKNYDEANLAFEVATEEIIKKSSVAEKYEFKYDQNTIKSLYWPASLKATSLLILISGTHGIEGHAGSAVQRWLLEQDMVLKRQNTDIVVIHGFNPFGFKNNRRVNEKNVDLNRNFIVDRANFLTDDTAYSNLNSVINPRGYTGSGFFAKSWFVMQALLKIMRYGLENLRNPVLQGQYTYPQGLFYGGAENSPQAKMIDEIIHKYISTNYRKIMIIDLHTGYGERSKLHLLAGHASEEKDQPISKIFDESEIDFGNKKSFYLVKGEMIKYLSEKIKNKITAARSSAQVSHVIFEYGTLDSQNTTGSIESLRRMVFENQNYWAQKANPDGTASQIQDIQKVENEYLEMFYPSDLLWREKIIVQTEKRMAKVINWLEN